VVNPRTQAPSANTWIVTGVICLLARVPSVAFAEATSIGCSPSPSSTSASSCSAAAVLTSAPS
jgi:hypothetical protein